MCSADTTSDVHLSILIYFLECAQVTITAFRDLLFKYTLGLVNISKKNQAFI